MRRAGAQEFAAVHALESRCFSVDAQSPRSLRYLLTRANASTVLACQHGRAVGYVMLLFRRNSRVARLYSIAVAPESRGQGVAEALAQAAQDEATEHGAQEIRLEIRAGNQASRRLFTRLGYRLSGLLPAYYPDGEDGIRMQKLLLEDGRGNG